MKASQTCHFSYATCNYQSYTSIGILWKVFFAPNSSYWMFLVMFKRFPYHSPTISGEFFGGPYLSFRPPPRAAGWGTWSSEMPRVWTKRGQRCFTSNQRKVSENSKGESAIYMNQKKWSCGAVYGWIDFKNQKGRYIYICQKCSYTYRFDINLKNQPYIYIYMFKHYLRVLVQFQHRINNKKGIRHVLRLIHPLLSMTFHSWVFGYELTTLTG